jgi:hypothetical protein
MFKEMQRREKDSHALNPILVMADSGARGKPTCRFANSQVCAA